MPYRGTKEELERRREALKGEAARLAKQRSELEGLAARDAEIHRELFDVESRLQGLHPDKDTLDLDAVRIASPCPADWDAMTGNERVRFCGKCQKNVYNLSAMSREEATALVNEKEGKMCARFYVREDGTLLTSDCPVGVRRKRVRLAVYGAAGASVFAGLSAFATTEPPFAQRTMGAIAPAQATVAPPQTVVAVAGGIGIAGRGLPSKSPQSDTPPSLATDPPQTMRMGKVAVGAQVAHQKMGEIAPTVRR